MFYWLFQFYLVIIMISVNAKIQNKIESNKEIDCSVMKIHGLSNGCDNYNKVNRHYFKKPKRIHYYPNWSLGNILNVTVESKFKNIYKERIYDAVGFFTHESDSLENDRLYATVTKFFRRSPILKVTTIESTTWKYQGNKSSEEIDESKSTLIDYPFSVSIQRKGAHYVSGALLDKWWIITSAGEFYHIRESLKLFRARLGSVDCKRGGVIIPIKKTIIHPYYIHGKPNFDVALIKMAYPIEFSEYVRPIAISNVNAKVISAKFMTTYWPRILVKGSTLPVDARERTLYNSMRVSTQRLIPRQMCIRIMPSLNETLNESSLCLKPVKSHHSVCMPDAGAPVVAGDGLWGITSGWISPTCPNITAPTIFTRLSSPSVRSWLDAELLSL